MSNIMDYLDWRGDVPFEVDPFNEVDNLVFAQAAYVLLDGIVGENGSISPKEATEEFFKRFSREEVERESGRHKAAPFLLEKICDAPRYHGLTIEHYVNRIDEVADSQISAMTFVFPDFSYVSFRGTDDSLVGWKEDFMLSFLPETEGQKMAAEYLNRFFSGSNKKLFVGGHSKGGNFAVFASAFCKPSIRRRIMKVFSNDGPGFLAEVTQSEEYANVLPKVTSILPESTLVGMLFDGRYHHKIVKSSAQKLEQHNGITWQVLGNHFVEAPRRSDDSMVADAALTKWLKGLSHENRIFFTDVFFDLLMKQGATTVEDLEGGIGGLLDMMINVHQLPKEQRKEFVHMIADLIRSFSVAQSEGGFRKKRFQIKG